VFLRIFSRHPELISLFPFRDVSHLDKEAETTAERLTATLEAVKQHPTFRNHAAAFASAIGMAVDDWVVSVNRVSVSAWPWNRLTIGTAT